MRRQAAGAQQRWESQIGNQARATAASQRADRNHFDVSGSDAR
jgi:hypothetical protein